MPCSRSWLLGCWDPRVRLVWNRALTNPQWTSGRKRKKGEGKKGRRRRERRQGGGERGRRLLLTPADPGLLSPQQPYPGKGVEPLAKRKPC